MLKTQKIHNHLSKHANNVIEIFDTDTEDKIVSKINLSQLESQAENLDAYFKNLHDKYDHVKTFGVQLFSSNGTTHKRTGYPISVAFNHTQKEMPKEVANPGSSATAQEVVARPVLQAPQTNPMQQVPVPNFGNTNNGLMGSMGLSMPQIISLHTKAERYSDVKEQLLDVKELLRKEREKNEVLTIDLRKSESIIAVAEQVKTLAVQAAEMKNKGLMESAGFKEIISQIGNIAPSLIQNQQPGGGLAGVLPDETFSDDKMGLIELIKDHNFSDAIAIQLVYVAIGLQNMPKFGNELKTLVEIK